MIHNAANLTFFQGIVEENNDPLGNGRVQIRVFGIHPPYEANEIQTEDLPWATLLNSSYGAFHRVPNLGEWVMGVSLDGADHTNLLVLGVIPGQNRSSPSGSSYAPNPYTKPSQDAIKTMGNPPIPPQMTGEDIHLTPILDNSALNIADNATTPDNHAINEPTTPTNGVPYNTTVWNASYDGSYIEMNDNPDNGYINIIHKSGTGITIDNSGTLKIKSLGDVWDGTNGHKKEFVAGRKDVVIENGNYTINATGGDIIMQCAGDVKISSSGNTVFETAGVMTLNGGNGIQLVAPRIGLFAHAENIELKAHDKIIADADTAIVENTPDKSINVSGGINATVGGAFNIQSGTFSAMGGGNAAFDYGMIHLNSGESVSPTMINVRASDVDSPEPPTAKVKSKVSIPSAISSSSILDFDDEREV